MTDYGTGIANVLRRMGGSPSSGEDREEEDEHRRTDAATARTASLF